jgi:hypothetical protein
LLYMISTCEDCWLDCAVVIVVVVSMGRSHWIIKASGELWLFIYEGGHSRPIAWYESNTSRDEVQISLVLSQNGHRWSWDSFALSFFYVYVRVINSIVFYHEVVTIIGFKWD